MQTPWRARLPKRGRHAATVREQRSSETSPCWWEDGVRRARRTWTPCSTRTASIGLRRPKSIRRCFSEGAIAARAPCHHCARCWYATCPVRPRRPSGALVPPRVEWARVVASLCIRCTKTDGRRVRRKRRKRLSRGHGHERDARRHGSAHSLLHRRRTPPTPLVLPGPLRDSHADPLVGVSAWPRGAHRIRPPPKKTAHARSNAPCEHALRSRARARLGRPRCWSVRCWCARRSPSAAVPRSAPPVRTRPSSVCGRGGRAW